MASYTNIRVSGREQYKNEHGVYPRGRGNWAFEISGDTFWPGPGMTYSSAKEKAQKEAVIRGVHVIKVLT